MSTSKFPVFPHNSNQSSNVNLSEDPPEKSEDDSSSPHNTDGGDPLLRFYQRLVPPNVRVFKREHPQRLPSETDEEYQFRWTFYEYAKLHPLTSPSYFYDAEIQDTLLVPVKESSSSSSSSCIPNENDIEPLPLSEPPPELAEDINTKSSEPNLCGAQSKVNEENGDFENDNDPYPNEDLIDNFNITDTDFTVDENILFKSALKTRDSHEKKDGNIKTNEIKCTKFQLCSSSPSKQSSLSCIPSTFFSNLSTSYSSSKLANKRWRPSSSSRPRSRSRSPTKRYKKSFEEMFNRPTSVPSQTWYENIALRRELTNRYTFVASSSASSRKMSAPLSTSKSHQKLITERLHSGKPTSSKSDRKMVSRTTSRCLRFL